MHHRAKACSGSERWLPPTRRAVLAVLLAAGRGAIAWTAAAADPPNSAAPLRLVKVETWAPAASAAAKCSTLEGGEVIIDGNGTHTCCGGWQFVFTGIEGGRAYRLRTRVEHRDLGNARDSLVAMVLWGIWAPDAADSRHTPWNYLLPRPVAADTMDFECVARAPEGATALTVRYTLRWSDHGSSRWAAPQIEPVSLPERKPVKVCIVNAPRKVKEHVKIEPLSAGLGLADDVAQSIDLWGSLILAACQRKPQLVVTPEVVIGGKDRLQGALEVPGPGTGPFEKIAREHQVHLVLGMRERRGDAFYNSAVLIGPEGVVGVYRKVHLATSEGLSGLSVGDSFPVFDTPIGRIGSMICMDTTVEESARLLALHGAEFICFPIMGDLRASRWSPGPPSFDEDIWKAIMRTRAIDNQVCMAIARNAVKGSCIINRKGDILAWNDGDQEIIEATVPLEDGYRVWNGGDFREVTFQLRRPHLYGAFTDEANFGPLSARKTPGKASSR